LQIAKYLQKSTYENNDSSNLFSIGKNIDGWVIKKLTEDTIYLSNDKEPQRLRPIQKELLKEFIDFYKANPNYISIQGNEERNIIKELSTAKFDRFLYGYDATLKSLAKYALSNKNELIIKKEDANSLLVPVGADWTDNTKLLGYFNPLANNGTGEYVKSEVLEFIEQANDNPEIPFFLILDEMNLSHVERYFSDFLSAMESHKPILLYKKPDGCESNIPETINLPSNLFVTGTVNIDETTYMFSPKVLDRANVIEFSPEKEDVLKLFTNPSEIKEIESAPDGMAEGFIDLYNKIQNNDDSIRSDISTELKEVFDKIYDILAKAGFEFAYRTVKEIVLYYRARIALNPDSKVDEIIDEQLLQKILPKIHGNRNQIKELLDNLLDFCDNNHLQHSKEKVERMKKQLDSLQFASFI
jgi:hypothetical protein